MKIKDIIYKARDLQYAAEKAENIYSDYIHNQYSKDLSEDKEAAIKKIKELQNKYNEAEEEEKKFLNTETNIN